MQLVTGIGCVWVVVACRFHVPDEDFEAARKAYEWPKKFSEVLREAGTKAAAEHRQFEAALKVRRKEFEQQIEQCVAKLAVVEGRSDIIKREVAVAEVSRLSGLQVLIEAPRSGHYMYIICTMSWPLTNGRLQHLSSYSAHAPGMLVVS